MATLQAYSRSVTMASDELKAIFCEPCIDDGKQIQARGFCVDCSEYLCRQCYKNHRRYKAFKNHVLQEEDIMPLDATKAGLPDVCRERCVLHPTKIVEYFCESCDIIGCNACITVYHRQCKYVNHIPDIVHGIEDSEEFVEFTKSLNNEVQVLRSRKKEISSNKSTTNIIRKQARKELKKQRNEINKFFDKLETKMDNDITDIDNRNRENLIAASNRFDLINGDLQRIKTDIEANQDNGQKCELFIAMKKSKSTMKQLDKEFNLLDKECKIQRYKLTQSRQIKDIIEKTPQICRLFTAEMVSEINVSSSKDKRKPRISGLAVVQHYLAVADDGNKSVKVINTRNGKMASELNMYCKHILNISCVDENEIAVSLIDFLLENTVKIYSVSAYGCLSRRYEIKCSFTCYDLVSFGQNFCLRTYEEISVVDTQGKLLKLVSKLERSVRDGIALSADNKSIYVTDSKNNRVQRMDLDGTVKAVYRDTCLKGFLAITVDREGLVYIRSSDNACVHQFTENLSKVQILLVEPGETIAYSNRENILYVGGYAGLVHLHKMS